MNKLSSIWAVLCSIVVLFTLCAQAAKKVNATVKCEKIMMGNSQKFNERAIKEKKLPTINELVNKQEMKSVSRFITVDKKEKVKSKQLYKGIEVFGAVTTSAVYLEGETVVAEVEGNLVDDIENDVPDVLTKMTPLDAINRAKEHKNNKASGLDIAVEKSRKVIFVDSNGKARLAFMTSYLVTERNSSSSSKDLKHKGDVNGISRPVQVIDAFTGDVIDSWEGLETENLENVLGTGGNLKTGAYNVSVNVKKQGENCILENENVRIVHMNGGTSSSVNSPAYQYNCASGPADSANGAYSPSIDAMYYGQKTRDMFMNYIGFPPFFSKIIIRTHYGNNFENAFWDGEKCSFGDGYTTYYPLAVQDFTAHELSHAFTQENAGLIYTREPGAINEAFSDLAGEALEFFLQGLSDYKVGFGMVKDPNKAARYFNDPTLDLKSISHAYYFTNTMNVHYSSGVFNKAFYQLSHATGWDIKKVFQLAGHANKFYWSQNTGFNEAVCSMLTAANDLGFNPVDVTQAFNTVGLEGCMNSNDIHSITDGISLSGINIAAGDVYKLKINFPSNKAKIQFHISGGGTAKGEIRAKSFYQPGIYFADFIEVDKVVNGFQFFEKFFAADLFITITAIDAISSITVTCTLYDPEPMYKAVPKTGLSAATGAVLYYKISVPSTMLLSYLEVTMNGGTGDGDLYYKYNSVPTTVGYDKRSWNSGNSDYIKVNKPMVGDHFVIVNAYSTFSDVQLVADYVEIPIPWLSNGGTVQYLSGVQSSKTYYKIQVPTGTSSLEFILSNMQAGLGDADIYVDFNKVPNFSAPYKSWLTGNNEKISTTSPQAGVWFVMIHGYTEYTGVQLVANYQVTGTKRHGIPTTIQENINRKTGNYIHKNKYLHVNRKVMQKRTRVKLEDLRGY